MDMAKKAPLVPLTRGMAGRLLEFTTMRRVSAQAARGVSQLQRGARSGGRPFGREARKRRRAILGEGRRGVQDCNCFSNGFISSISVSFHGNFQFIKAITVTSRH